MSLRIIQVLLETFFENFGRFFGRNVEQICDHYFKRKESNSST